MPALSKTKPQPRPKTVANAAFNEHLRRRFRPTRVRILFVGESPPASGRFFYRADSGLYRAIRDTFIDALSGISESNFLESFRGFGCYLVDLCGTPVNHLSNSARKQLRLAGEARLSETIRELQPDIIVAVVQSISNNVTRAQEVAHWSGRRFTFPYPGRWHHHRTAFQKQLTKLLRSLA